MNKIFFTGLVYLAIIAILTTRSSSQEMQNNLISNFGFESPSGWQVQMQNGATGDFSFDTNKSRSGKRSLKLSKTNSVGYVELRSEKPVHIDPNVLYTFRGWFHAEDAPISSLLLFRISRDGKALRYNSIDTSKGWTSQSLLINSPADHWEKRAVTYKSDKEEEIYLHIVLWGNPSTVWIDDLELSPGTQRGKSPTVTYKDPYSEAQVLKILKERPVASAKVVKKNNEMQFEVNGKSQPFVIYKGMSPSDKIGDQEAFGKDGIDLNIVAVQMGQNRYAYVPDTEKLIWYAQGKINFQVIDDILLQALRRNPHANLIVNVSVYPYLEWGDENPDAVVRNEKGERGYGIWGNLTGYASDLKKVESKENKAWWYPSYQSEKWRKDSQGALSAIANHLKTSPYGKAVVGFFISGGQDGRFVPSFDDYSIDSETSFREWTLKKYGSIENVEKAWNQQINSPEDIRVPHFAQQKTESLTPYQNPGQSVDYREFKEEGSWTLRDGYAKVLKESIGKPVVTICYNSPANENFLHTKYLDASGDMSHYPYRNPGYASSWLPGNGFEYHHKMFLQEVDLRSWVGSCYDEIYQMWVGAGLTPASWDSIHRKMVGDSLAHGYGWWYYDMNNYFADPRIHQMIASTYQVGRRLNAMPKSTFKADVCVIDRDYPDPYLTNRSNPADSARNFQNALLESSGVPFETHYLNDVLNYPELQNFKVYIFRQNTYITQSQRQQIKEKLLNKNRTIVWMNDVGYISEKGKSIADMSDLIGINVNTAERYTRLHTIVTNHDSPLTQNTLPFQGMGEMVTTIFNTNDGPNPFGARYQPFWIEDPSATILGTYQETGKIAMTVKEFPDWTSIYLAAPQALGAKLMNNIAKQAGAFVGGDAGEELDMNGNFASLHGLKSMQYTLHLPPGKTRILDALSGKVLSDNKEKYTFPVEAQKTYWFFFE